MCVSWVSKFFPIEQGHSIIFQSRGENQKVLEDGGGLQLDQEKIEKKETLHTHTSFSYTCVQKKSKLCLHVMYLHDELI